MKALKLIIILSLLVVPFTAVGSDDNIAAMKAFTAETWTIPSVGMVMKAIPAGSFTMGSPVDEICRRDDEVQHRVTIAKPFYMAVFECRQGEFYKLMMPPDYDFEAWTAFRGPIHDGTAYTYRFPKADGGVPSPVGYTYPMDMLSWNRAAEFCRKLTEVEQKAGRLPAGYVYRLPTEAEWEYACRAGSSGPYSFDEDYTKGAVMRKYTYAGSGGYYTFGVGDTASNRKPNAWGLYDMHGNVWEWCLDWYAPYRTDNQTDPVGPASGEKKVVRGGSCMPWFDDSAEWLEKEVHPFLRSAARYSFKPNINFLIVTGFRVVLAADLSETSLSVTAP